MIETFVPLYISNHCDSCCAMCNLRRGNEGITRIEATFEQIYDQLTIIQNYERIRAVCILTGERFGNLEREHNLGLVIETIGSALKLGFERILFNVGSLRNNEIERIRNAFNENECSRLVLSLFQETYDRATYKKYFGISAENPKADYDTRIATPDLWVKNGFKVVDIGILLGFGNDTNADVESLIAHANRLSDIGAEVYISTPRIKDGLVSDNDYELIIARLRESIPSAKLIITTREEVSFINKILKKIDVVSPGSSDICPYSIGEYVSNNIATSQFVIAEKRLRPSVVLDMLACNRIRYYNDV